MNYYYYNAVGEVTPGQPTSDPPRNQGQPLGNVRAPPGNQPYGVPPGDQFNNPQYQPPPMNQAGGRYQVMLCVLSLCLHVSYYSDIATLPSVMSTVDQGVGHLNTVQT